MDTMQNPLATLLKRSSEKWEFIKNYPLDPHEIPNLPEKCYIFLDRKSYVNLESSREELLRHFNVPAFLGNTTCTELNGYFGCKMVAKDKTLESYSTWFRCLVKMVHEEPVHEGKAYIWYEMGFFTYWDRLGHCRVICIDTPEELQSGLEDALQKQSSSLDSSDPFAMHAPLLDQIILLYDDSVWRVRDPVRKIEKTRQVGAYDFGALHDVSRHSIHVSEVLSVTIETMEGILRQQKSIYRILQRDLTRNYREQAQEYTSFQLQLVKSLKLRALSNHERLTNEIGLAFNMLSRQDNMVVKSIALLTMVFLPATFVSALFSTTFFTFGDARWTVSSQLWVYFVVTIPSTILIMLIWRSWVFGIPEPPFTSKPWKKLFERTRPASLKGSGQVV